MEQIEEILNIEHHVKRMVLIALNRFADKKQAAKALGITPRTLNRYIDQFYISYEQQEYKVNPTRQHVRRAIA